MNPSSQTLFEAIANPESTLAHVVSLARRFGEKNHRDADGSTPLIFSAQRGRLDCVRFFLHAGADLEERDHNGWTALFWATCNEDLELVRFLVQNGADLNGADNRGLTSVIFACAEGAMAPLTLLADLGADLNLDIQGWNAASYAVWHGQPRVVEFLASRGVDLSAAGLSGKTPIHLAVSQNVSFQGGGSGRLECLKALIELGAALNDVNVEGRTPAMLAAHLGLEDPLWALALAGADLACSDPQGACALSLALDAGHGHCAAFIESRLCEASLRSLTAQAGAGPRARI